MNRLLACIAVLSASGCSCFDDRYREYCDASPRCRAGASPIGRVKFFDAVQNPADAVTCYPLVLELTLPDGGMPAPFPPTAVGFTMTPPGAFDVFDSPDCDGGLATQLVATVGRPALSFHTRRFGNVELRVDLDAPDSEGDVAGIVSRAFFSWSPAGYYVPSGGCAAGNALATLEARASANNQPVPAAAPTLFRVALDNGFTGVDVDGGCSPSPGLWFDAGSWSATLGLGGTAAPATGLLRFNAQPGSVTQVAFARLDTRCAPLSSFCGGPAPCCGEGSCDFLTGYCAADAGHPCLNATDCYALSCSGTCQ